MPAGRPSDDLHLVLWKGSRRWHWILKSGLGDSIAHGTEDTKFKANQASKTARAVVTKNRPPAST